MFSTFGGTTNLASKFALRLPPIIAQKVKFVASDSGLQHVMARMAGIFQIPMAKKQAFKSQFKKIVMDSLNAKRAFCEQQAGKVVLSK